MARFVYQFPTTKTPDQAYALINQYMAAEGFSTAMYNGEPIWKKGVGFLAAPQYIRVFPTTNGTVNIEAFIKYAILPGVYVGEMGLDGFFGFAIKKVLRDRVNVLIQVLS